MKPDRIFIVRHGESEGNADRKVYGERPDYALRLTVKGVRQAQEAGMRIAEVVKPSKLMMGNQPSFQFYVSPFWRTRQTFLGLRQGMQLTMGKFKEKYYEDPRLREQEWGQKLEDRSGYKDNLENERDSYGHFYWRFESGESCSDVFDRVSDFMGTLFRDFEKKNYPRNVIIVTHGMTMRLFLMRWFHCSVEEFESWANPWNCSYYLLERTEGEKYELTTPVRTHRIKHDYVFDWGKESQFGDLKIQNVIPPAETHES